MKKFVFPDVGGVVLPRVLSSLASPSMDKFLKMGYLRYSGEYNEHTQSGCEIVWTEERKQKILKHAILMAEIYMAQKLQGFLNYKALIVMENLMRYVVINGNPLRMPVDKFEITFSLNSLSFQSVRLFRFEFHTQRRYCILEFETKETDYEYYLKVIEWFMLYCYFELQGLSNHSTLRVEGKQSLENLMAKIPLNEMIKRLKKSDFSR